MIVTLTLNPALDTSFHIDRLQPEKKLRVTNLRVDAGGGGINVSRGVHILGGSTLALFPAGGGNGQRLQAELAGLGVPFQAVATDGETRESISVFDEHSGQQYRFVLPGRPLDGKVLEQLLRYELTADATLLVISGSMPPQTPPGYLARWVKKARAAGVQVLGDSSGAALQELLEAGVNIVKPSLSELAALSGKETLAPEDIEATAKALGARFGTGAVIVSLGSSGAALASDNSYRFAAPPTVAQSSAGAGDSMVAGIAWMLGEGASLPNAVAFGIACGSASTLHEGTQLFTKQDVGAYYKWVLANSPGPTYPAGSRGSPP